MHRVNQPLAIFDKACLIAVAAAETGPIAGVAIFHHIKATVFQVGPKVFKALDLVLRDMAAVVQDQIKGAEFLRQCRQKVGIRLIADTHLCTLNFKVFAGRINVDEGQAATLGKVILPHGN